MDKSAKNGIIIGVVVAIIGASAFVYFRNKKNQHLSVNRKLKGKAKEFEDQVQYLLEDGRKLVFYNNGRLFLFTKDSNWLLKGKYKKGGEVITITEVSPALTGKKEIGTVYEGDVDENIKNLVTT